MRYRKLHPITADMRREISVAALAKAGAFICRVSRDTDSTDNLGT